MNAHIHACSVFGGDSKTKTINTGRCYGWGMLCTGVSHRPSTLGATFPSTAISQPSLVSHDDLSLSCGIVSGLAVGVHTVSSCTSPAPSHQTEQQVSRQQAEAEPPHMEGAQQQKEFMDMDSGTHGTKMQ